ncbi:hypothetical protein AAIP21_12890 [Pseudomonas aeruginosa]
MIRDKQKAFVILEGLRAYEFFKPVDLRGLKGNYSKEELLGKMPDDEFEHYLKLLEGRASFAPRKPHQTVSRCSI